MTPEEIIDQGYESPRQLPDGRWIALARMLFTWGIVVDIDPISWRTRYCYEHRHDAIEALRSWDGAGDPPGPWIKQKPENRLNTRWANDNL